MINANLLHESVFEEIDRGVNWTDAQSQNPRVRSLVGVTNPNSGVQTVALDLNRRTNRNHVTLFGGGDGGGLKKEEAMIKN